MVFAPELIAPYGDVGSFCPSRGKTAIFLTLFKDCIIKLASLREREPEDGGRREDSRVSRVHQEPKNWVRKGE